MFKSLLRPLAAALLLAAPMVASADHLRPHLLLTAHLTGDQQNPAVVTTAQGVAGFTLNQTRDTLFVQAAFSGLSGAITGAHVHDGAMGASGPIITSLVPMLNGNRLSGFLTGADITPAKLAKYLRGLYYINIHTAANPGGEIRGQIRLESETGLVANLTGSQQVPAVMTSATGLGVFILSQSQDKLKFRVVYAGLSGPVTGAHFHMGVPGGTGPVVVSLLTYVSGNVLEGEIVPTAAFLTSLTQGQIYINIHTTANPGGEIRGQVYTDTRNVAHEARLDGNQVVPVGAYPSAGKAIAIGRLSATLDSMTVIVAHDGLSGAPTGVALYNAPAGQSNTAANLVTTSMIMGGSTGNIVTLQLAGLTPAVVNAFLRGDINVVLNTAASPTGEIRGQLIRLAREGYTIALNGAQQRPTPVNTTGYGVGVVSIDRDQTNAHFMSVWGGLTGPAMAGHFHTGLSSQTGPVVFPLTPFFDNTMNPAAVYGYWKNDNMNPFTRVRSLQFRGDSIYMNLHTMAFPSGEIRGQVYRGARNLQRVLATQPAAIVAGTFGTFPNPFATGLTLSFDARVSGTGHLEVSDLLGRKVFTQTVVVRPGANSLPLALPGVASGVYLLTLEVGGTRLVSRIAKEE